MCSNETEPRTLTMTEKLILFFAAETKGWMTDLSLFKFLYLADLYAVKWRGEQLTTLTWIRYDHGPWEESVYSAISALEEYDLVARKPTDYRHWRVIPTDAGYKAKKNLDLELGIQLVLENIHRAWSGIRRDEVDRLLKYVYSTAPMVEITQREKAVGGQKLLGTHLRLKSEREKLLSELELEDIGENDEQASI